MTADVTESAGLVQAIMTRRARGRAVYQKGLCLRAPSSPIVAAAARLSKAEEHERIIENAELRRFLAMFCA